MYRCSGCSHTQQRSVWQHHVADARTAGRTAGRTVSHTVRRPAGPAAAGLRPWQYSLAYVRAPALPPLHRRVVAWARQQVWARRPRREVQASGTVWEPHPAHAAEALARRRGLAARTSPTQRRQRTAECLRCRSLWVPGLTLHCWCSHGCGQSGYSASAHVHHDECGLSPFAQGPGQGGRSPFAQDCGQGGSSPFARDRAACRRRHDRAGCRRCHDRAAC
mmetsp:Transcript_15620/g.46093  ORF Transcript_15620/g.46093 Transcript_15620/m.46093 type:complete len:220 (+) Transcript_15620:512-1171(+)|eukprot:365023-Chlamydomonas_euryale.AAC.38